MLSLNGSLLFNRRLRSLPPAELFIGLFRFFCCCSLIRFPNCGRRSQQMQRIYLDLEERDRSKSAWIQFLNSNCVDAAERYNHKICVCLCVYLFSLWDFAITFVRSQSAPVLGGCPNGSDFLCVSVWTLFIKQNLRGFNLEIRWILTGSK